MPKSKKPAKPAKKINAKKVEKAETKAEDPPKTSSLKRPDAW